MASNHVQPGKVLEYTNATAAAISSGDVVQVGQILGVALVDIAIGESGSVQIDGVFTVPKVTAAVIAQGESLTWDVSAGKFDDNLATPATGDVTGAPALAFEAAGNTATELAVKFTGVPGTVT
jgi:predicted RecA/RadA family phage recombinase